MRLFFLVHKSRKISCKLEKIHENYKVSSVTVVGKVCEYFRTNEDFKSLYKSFCRNVLKSILEDTKIVIQQLPDIFIFPSNKKSNGGIINIIEQDDIKFNCHTDGEKPYYNPSWETNFWIPMVDVDENNTMYVMDDKGQLKPCLLKHGQILEADLNTIQHGTKTLNSSKNSRVSLVSRGYAYRDYDLGKLSDGIINSKNINFKQKVIKYFSVGGHYMEV